MGNSIITFLLILQVRRAAGRNEMDEAVRKNSLVPTYTLHHLVKERYPRFIDALGDLDDALSLTFLFAALPAHSNIPASVINKSKSLAAAWGAYCATTSAITKSFISVKGVYFEAEITEVPVRWVIPHAFTQYLPDDVDFRIMRTFQEFYETLLNFVLFKLYADLGVRYPFQMSGENAVGSTSAILGTNLRALENALDSSKGAVSNIVSEAVEKEGIEQAIVDVSGSKSKNEKTMRQKELVKSVSAALSKVREDASDSEKEDEDDDESVDVTGPLQAALENVANEEAQAALPGGSTEMSDERIKRRRLFEGLTFYLSREVPRGYLELVCLAYGAKVGWEGDDSPISMNDPSVTHHVVDRPRLPSSYESLPKSREYIQPQWILDCCNFMFILPMAKYAVGATLPPHLSPWVDDEEEGYKPAYAEEIERLKNGEVPDTADEPAAMEESDIVKDDDIAEEIDGPPEEEEDEEESEEDEEEGSEEQKKQRETKKRKREAEEAHVLAKSMMSRKAAHLYGRMQHGIAKKQAEVDELQKRRKDIENAKGKDAAGRTALKQKVDRLKEERKAVEESYDKTGGTMKRKSKKKRTS